MKKLTNKKTKFNSTVRKFLLAFVVIASMMYPLFVQASCLR